MNIGSFMIKILEDPAYLSAIAMLIYTAFLSYLAWSASSTLKSQRSHKKK
jgi:hypothetical protein